jgi:NodT family efflux transporter outer membrane factor (OMF) lipoprotein
MLPFMAPLAGCTVGPDFLRPKAPDVSGYTNDSLPAKTASADIPGGQAQSLAMGQDIPGQWWTLFHSPKLSALIDAALKNSPNIQAAQAALRQARENVYAGEGAWYPKLAVSAGVQREQISGAIQDQPKLSETFNLYNASASVSYSPDVFGGTSRTIESLQAQADYQRFQLEASYLALTANLVTAIVTESSLSGQITALQDIIKDQSEQLDVVRTQFNLGAAARSDVLAQESTVAQTRALLPPLQSQLAQLRDQITALAGKYPSQDDGTAFDLADLRLPETLPVSLPTKLVEQRPDIRAAEAQLHAASALVGVAVANQLPMFNLTANYGLDAVNTHTLFLPSSIVWGIAGSVAETIFDGGTLLHKRKAAEAAFDQAAASYRGAVVTAFQNVSDALRALEYDAVTLGAQLAAERAAADNLEISRSQYQLGSITYLTLLNAETSYQNTRIALVKAQAARFADTAALFQALGGGWWNRIDDASADAAKAGSR